MARLQNSTATAPAASEKPARNRSEKRSASKATARDRSTKATARRENNSKPERSSKKRDLNISVTMELHEETKNKVHYLELDDNGDKVENPFRDGVLGHIYLPKSETGTNPPKQITVTVTVE
ncbi:MAG TPA: hypothetical protein VH280_02605 [Verrucomicrobiae bacterium]|jgi:hypothetical protein|nr:hypothetical protein [Verrucomicrobiae bacterium]